MDNMEKTWLDDVTWDSRGLVTAIAQEQGTGTVLMVAWMNREALSLTAQKREAVYFSRSRNKLWYKGEESGHTQTVHDIRLDCDGDVVLLTVTQHGGIACHTGRHSCFFNQLLAPNAQTSDELQWQQTEPVLKDPGSIYK
jgi:phosphoribosyl-AMP cyclohydrolase